MSGEIVLLENDSAGRIAAFIQTLGRLPGTPEWVLVGGLAVNVRVARLHRATNDADKVAGTNRVWSRSWSPAVPTN